MKNSPPSRPDCLGIPVRFDPRMRGISNSRGVGRWKAIFVGSAFGQFPPREQAAILLHEAGHCKLRHLEQRLKRLHWAFWKPHVLAAFCAAQEFEADRFAAGCGYGADLARAFSRLQGTDTPLHPPMAERIARLAETQSVVGI